VDIRKSILVITIITACLQWLFLIVVAREITSILGISVFFTKQSTERRRVKQEVSDSDSEEKIRGKGLHDPLLVSSSLNPVE